MAQQKKPDVQKDVQQKPQPVSISLEDYLKQVPVNPGLVASFKVEALTIEDGLKNRPKEDWDAALEAQSKRVYE